MNDDGLIHDMYQGMVYKDHIDFLRHPVNISLLLNTDGVAIFKSSCQNVPVYQTSHVIGRSGFTTRRVSDPSARPLYTERHCIVSTFDITRPHYTCEGGLNSQFLIATMHKALELNVFHTKGVMFGGARPKYVEAIKYQTGL